MNILELTEDSIAHIVHNVDIVSFIFLMSTCKYFYDLRMVLVRFVSDSEQYKEYLEMPIINILMNSYINLAKFRVKLQLMIDKPSNKNDYHKMKNTMTIMACYCAKYPGMYNFHCTIVMLDMCCKSVCNKYRYKYSKQPYHKIYKFFWEKWHTCGINFMDICEIIYHIKNRKYRNLYNTLANIKFRIVNKQTIYNTIEYMQSCTKLEDKIEFNTGMIYLIYPYMTCNMDVLQEIANTNINLKTIIMEKASEHVWEISEMPTYPKYLKDFIIGNIMYCYDCISAM